MSEIEEFDEQMQDLLQGIKFVLEKEIPSLKGVERIDVRKTSLSFTEIITRCSYVKNRLVRAKQVHRTILVELREIPKDQSAGWEAKARDYETQIAQLTQDVDWAETTAKTGDTGQKKRTVDDMTTKEITQQAMVVQDQTKDATERIIRNIQQTEAVGDVALVIAVEVNDELHKQGEQLQNVKEGLVSVESNLKRADKQLRVFMRRLSTDKVFLLFIFLTVIGIVVAIVLYILKQKGDRFAYESKFSKYSDDNDEITRKFHMNGDGPSNRHCVVSQLEPLYQTSHLSQAEFAQIWTLISLASPSINQEQFVYFQHVLASRRRGRPLPVGLPLSVKEAFLKAKPESKMYTRYIPGTRDIAASTWKDAAQLQEEQRVVEQDIATHEVAREEAERALSELTITSDEMAGLAGYKRNHLSAVRDDVGMLRESLRLLKAGVGKSSGADTGSGVMQKDVDDLLAKLLEEKRALEARKQALLVRLH
ncbi:hypothetical protein HDU83_003258 [Entophlyctis luteolus]|nr:hypothetical protein HDU83_003258 [Entophlyctis luteolus]